MSLDIQLLGQICKTPGAPGFEGGIRKLVHKHLKPLVDETRIDRMGNLIGFKKGKSSEKLVITAHLDEIAFIVQHIDEKGFIRFHPLGGFDPKTLTAQRVIVHGKKDLIGVMGSKPIHLMSPDERNKAPKIEDYFIDMGMDKAEVEKWIQIGNPITRERELIEIGDCVNSKSLDNRISVFILLETLKNLQGKELPYDLYTVFTVQEEVGLRGAITASQDLSPDYCIALDVTIAFDVPNAMDHEKVSQLGKGVAIKVLDGSIICDQRMVEFMKNLAIGQKIPWQLEILPKGGTDTAAFQRFGGPTIAGALSIPCRHVHQVIEMCHKSDILNTMQLLEECVLKLDQQNWDYEE